MPLGKCPDCDQAVSPAAAFCPHCGHPGALDNPLSVTVQDVQVRFWSLVWFLVKLAVAALPALAILLLMGVAAAAFFGGLTTALR